MPGEAKTGRPMICSIKARMRLVLPEPARRRGRGFVDAPRTGPSGDSPAEIRVGQDEIDRLILGAKGWRAVLLGQLPIDLDDIGQRLVLQSEVPDG